MSALPPKADIRECEENVRFGPKALDHAGRDGESAPFNIRADRA